MAKAKKKPTAKKNASKSRAAAPKIKKAAKESKPTTAEVVTLVTQSIPLSQLQAWDGNVRKTLDPKTLEELEASIPAHGLFQSLVVKPDGKNNFLVITGRHRLTALFNLRDRGVIDANYPVPCQIAADNVSLEEIGLAENIIRAEMNAADQFEVFNRLLTETDATYADVAARFGTTETIVKKRMALGGLIPEILQGYRDGILNLEQLQALTACADHKKQKRYYFTGDIDGRPPKSGKIDIEELRELWKDKSGSEIRKELTETEVRGDDKRARFVGLDAYRAAGGKERAWLFSDDESGIYLLNPEILNKLVEEKLQQLVAEVKAEGWSWVSASLTGDFNGSKYTPAKPKSEKLSPADQKTVDDLKAQQKKLGDFWELSDEDEQKYHAIDDRISQIRNNAKTWTNKTKEIAGAFVTMSEHGYPEITRGLIENATAKKMEKESKKAAKDKAKGKAAEQPHKAADPDSEEFTPDMSKKIMESFTTHQTFAVGATVARNAEAGLCCLLHPLVMHAVYDSSHASIFNASFSMTEHAVVFDGVDTTKMDETDNEHPLKGYSEMRRALQKWIDRAPTEDTEQLETDVLQWLFGLTMAELCQLAALLAGLCLVDKNTTGRRDPMTTFLMRKFNVDMAKWYSPRAGSLFNHLSKSQLLDIIPEIRGEALTPEEKNYKKPALAKLAEDEAIAAEDRGQPWLPIALRAPKPVDEEHTKAPTGAEETQDDQTEATSDNAAETAAGVRIFQPGDLVFKTNGDPTGLNMTVERVDYAAGEIICVWFEQDRKRTGIFAPDTLQFVRARPSDEEADTTDAEDDPFADDDSGDDVDDVSEDGAFDEEEEEEE